MNMHSYSDACIKGVGLAWPAYILRLIICTELLLERFFNNCGGFIYSMYSYIGVSCRTLRIMNVRLDWAVLLRDNTAKMHFSLLKTSRKSRLKTIDTTIEELEADYVQYGDEQARIITLEMVFTVIPTQLYRYSCDLSNVCEAPPRCTIYCCYGYTNDPV